MNIHEDSGGTAAQEVEVKERIGLSSSQPACAACRFQRRKCSPDCPLAPYFPAHRIQDFRNVRKLFGVKNILKTLSRHLEPSAKFTAVECMIFEANCRARDLAGGCYKIIANLQREITILEAQHRVVHRQLRFFRQYTAAPSPGLTALLLNSDNSLQDWMIRERSLNNVFGYAGE